MGKVIHVSDELHARLRDYCEKEGVPMSIWASDVLTMALDNGTVIENWRKVDAAPVERKKLPRMEAQNGDDPWQSEPFWERKGKEPEKQLEEDGPRAPKRVGGEGAPVGGAPNEVRKSQEEGPERTGTGTTTAATVHAESPHEPSSKRGEPGSPG